MELAAEDGRAQRNRSYLRILAPPPTFSVSVSGAELRAAARRSRFPYYPAIHARPPTALCVLGCPWTALHLSFLHKHAIHASFASRACSIPATATAAAYLGSIFYFWPAPFPFFFLLILLATTPSRCRQHGLYFTVPSSSLLPQPPFSSYFQASTPGSGLRQQSRLGTCRLWIDEHLSSN
ncbi:uncharacterized protein BO88DRAFT_97420 [Aspergillus vadensis CBS 113365]|uniref:Uncharacterized protein n=1 Tax=Aspergillus vadensis (strain CBS 113365 / IMI 142717 / IBT 24658) TaxID=1448311 RepID=A0A319BL87_ASPVC|nr:hypothetical protein BO88DRAFT_97420 [Aspergillus vadensis CBS 113365]PYH73477.1 hypothetical protein BO88DRAFT_97420 [Aspergillus vadensis CBS 113365]